MWDVSERQYKCGDDSGDNVGKSLVFGLPSDQEAHCLSKAQSINIDFLLSHNTFARRALILQAQRHHMCLQNLSRASQRPLTTVSCYSRAFRWVAIRVST